MSDVSIRYTGLTGPEKDDGRFRVTVRYSRIMQKKSLLYNYLLKKILLSIVGDHTHSTYIFAFINMMFSSSLSRYLRYPRVLTLSGIPRASNACERKPFRTPAASRHNSLHTKKETLIKTLYLIYDKTRTRERFLLDYA